MKTIARSRPETKPYVEPLSDFLQRMVNRLRGAYRSFDAELQSGEYMEAVARMEAEFGRDRTSEAITRAIDSGGGKDGTWLPTIAEIRSFVPPKQGERKRCRECERTEGFVMVGEGKERRAKRCTHEATA